jgi:hypothetical protein
MAKLKDENKEWKYIKFKVFGLVTGEEWYAYFSKDAFTGSKKGVSEKVLRQIKKGLTVQWNSRIMISEIDKKGGW